MVTPYSFLCSIDAIKGLLVIIMAPAPVGGRSDSLCLNSQAQETSLIGLPPSAAAQSILITILNLHTQDGNAWL